MERSSTTGRDGQGDGLPEIADPLAPDGSPPVVRPAASSLSCTCSLAQVDLPAAPQGFEVAWAVARDEIGRSRDAPGASLLPEEAGPGLREILRSRRGPGLASLLSRVDGNARRRGVAW